MDIKDQSEATDLTINDKIFTEAISGFKLHLGASNFYKNSELLPNLIVNKEPVLASCPVGKERSFAFNSQMPLAAITVPKITSEGKNGIDSPLNQRVNEGVSLLQLFEILTDDITVSEDGLMSKYFDKPIKHFVLISQLDNFPFINKIGKAFGLLKAKYGKNLPVTVDLVVEEDVQKFQKETRDFVQRNKAA